MFLSLLRRSLRYADFNKGALSSFFALGDLYVDVDQIIQIALLVQIKVRDLIIRFRPSLVLVQLQLLLITSKRVVVILLNKVILLLLQILFNELVLIDLVDAKWCVLHHSVFVFVRFSEFIRLVLG